MFIWRNIVSVRNRALLLVSLPILSLAVSFAPFFTQTASAFSADDVLNRARAWSALNTIIENRQYMLGDVSNDKIGKCDFFRQSDGISNQVVYVGPPVTGDPNNPASWNRVVAQPSTLINALSSVGIEGGCRQLLLDIGYTPTGDGLKKPDDFGDRLSQRIRDTLAPNAFFGANIGDGQPGDALSYALIIYTLKNVCGWQYRNPFVRDDNPATTEGARNREAQVNSWNGIDSGKHYYTYSYENGKAGFNTYYKNGGSAGEVHVGPRTGFAPSGNQDAKLDCGDNNAQVFGAKLGDNHRFADAYAALLKPGGETNPGTCADRYAESAAQLAACDAGFRNRDNTSFCEANYPGVPIDSNGPILDACKYGAGPATGGSDVTTPPPGSETGEGVGSDKTTCAITGIGWIICPVFTFLSQITDSIYTTVVSNLLEVEPLSTASSSPMFNAWSIMRNFANVAFVIAFLVIIYSQITSVGISNYGIKKMLPKLIVTAILVNVSYWLCAIAVDISNILGSSIYKLLLDVQNDAGLSLPQTGAFSSGKGWTAIAGPLLAGTLVPGALFFVTLSVFLPMIVAVLATIITVILALILRQALIVILIVISPLIFAAYLLPNTEPLGKNAMSISKTLLLIYPVIALVFGGSALASTIIMTSSDVIYIQIAGAAAAVIPLVAAPALMSAINGVMNRFGLPNVGVKLDRMRKSAEGVRDRNIQRRQINSLNGNKLSQFRSLGRYTRGAKKDAIAANLKAEQARAAQSYVAGQTTDADGNATRFGKQLAGGTFYNTPDSSALQRALAGAKFTIERAEAEEVKAHHAEIDNFDETKLMEVIKNASGEHSETKVAAAMERLVKIGDQKNIAAAMEQYGTDGSNGIVNRSLAGALRENGPGYLKASDIDNVARGQFGLYGKDAAGNTVLQSTKTQDVAAANVAAGVLAPDKMVSASNDELQYASDAAAALAATGDMRATAKLQKTAAEVKSNANLRAKIKHNGDAIDSLEQYGTI